MWLVEEWVELLCNLSVLSADLATSSDCYKCCYKCNGWNSLKRLQDQPKVLASYKIIQLILQPPTFHYIYIYIYIYYML